LPSEDRESEARERARKIDRRYVDGELVKVAYARNQAEAELIQGLLLEEGVPSMLRRTRGFDVPDMLAAGPRDIVVPESGAVAAREILLAADLAVADPEPVVRPGPLAVWLGGTVALVAVIAWIGTELLG
jgi:hypothetical protein